MKLKKSLSLLTATMLLFACSQEDESMPRANQDDGVKSVRITLSGVQSPEQSRAISSAPVDQVGDGAAGVINDVQIYITDNTGKILRAEKMTTASTSWADLTTAGVGVKFINVPKNTAQVHVYANLGSRALVVEGNNVSTVPSTFSLIDQLDISNILYLGKDEALTTQDEPITPNATVGKTYIAEVTLTPVVARIQINKVTFKQPGSQTVTKKIGGVDKTATVGWTTFSGDLHGIYLNNFYPQTIYGVASGTIMHNTSAYPSAINSGSWMFGATNAAVYAAYANYTTAFQPLPLQPVTGKCYAFNFFPAISGEEDDDAENMSKLPKLHFYLDNLVATGLTTTDRNVFNPLLFPATGVEAFVNVTSYFESNGTTPITKFERGKIYNMDIEIMPYYLQEDITKVQYNVICRVTVTPWSAKTIIPGFEK